MKNANLGINALNLRDAKDALILGECNLDALKQEARTDALRRVAAIRDRIGRLQATEKQIQAVARIR
jgi:hypothetical protein